MSDTTHNPQADWKATLIQSAALKDKSADQGKKASRLLWDGAQGAIASWLPSAATDVAAEGLYGDVMDALGGKSRKGDASKIKTVALAVKNNGLVLATYPNLAKAYAEAKRLTTTAQAEQSEDDAMAKVVAALSDAAPKSASTPENAAKIVLAQGPATAAALLLDALGADEQTHRSLLRALSQEIASRAQAKAQAAKAAKAKTKVGPKAGTSSASKAKGGAATAPTKPKATKAKTKGAAVKAATAKQDAAKRTAAKPTETPAPAPVQAAKPPVVRPRPTMVTPA